MAEDRRGMFLFLLLSFFVGLSFQRNLDLGELQRLVHDFEDEIISHDGLAAEAQRVEQNGDDLDEDVPHPVGVHNWGSNIEMGQISGVAVNPSDQPVIFHRGPVVWNDESFDSEHKLKNRKLIERDTIMILDPDTGDVVSSFGKGRFYMPHGITVDGMNNVYVTDVGLHQVMRFPAGSETPDLVLGKAFEPGTGKNHFCKPTDVAVIESTGEFFVADGYCNSRVLKYNKDGELIKSIDGNWNVVHSLALFEDEDVLCVADREGRKIDCFGAGLRRPLGQEVISYGNIGRVFAIASKGTALIAINGQPRPQGITIDTSANDQPKIIDTWGRKEGLSDPHDVAISLYGDAIYVSELDPVKRNRLHKFEVIHRIDDVDMF